MYFFSAVGALLVLNFLVQIFRQMGSCLPLVCTNLWCPFCEEEADDSVPLVKETFTEEAISEFKEGRLRQSVNGYTFLKTLGKGVVGKVKLVEKASTHQVYVHTLSALIHQHRQ